MTKYFYYLIKQLWIYFYNYNLLQIFSITIEIIFVGLNSYAFYLYFLSLEGCTGTQVECLDKFKPEYFYYLGFMCIYSSLIISFTTTLSLFDLWIITLNPVVDTSATSAIYTFVDEVVLPHCNITFGGLLNN